jgi:Zn-dependent metalloprotease
MNRRAAGLRRYVTLLLGVVCFASGLSAFAAKDGRLPGVPDKQIGKRVREFVTTPDAEVPAGGVPCSAARRWKHVTTYSECDHPGKKSQPERSTRGFLKGHAPGLGMQVDGKDLKLVQTKRGLSTHHTRFQQLFAGHPIYNAQVIVGQNAGGRVHRVHSGYIRNPLVVGNTTPTISKDEAETIAIAALLRQHSGEGDPELRAPTVAELNWYPLTERQIVLVWTLTLRSREPFGDFLTLVDANTGEVLLQENLLVFTDSGQGYAYVPNPVQTSGDPTVTDNDDATDAVLDGARSDVVLEGLNAGTLLKGGFADVATLDPPFCPRPDGCADADEADRMYFYDRSDPRFEQVVAYHAIDTAQRYVHALGYDDDSGPPNGIRDFPTLANVHWFNDDRSFYDPSTDTLHFGDGGVDDAEDADIVVHEYGHAIQRDQNACWPGGQNDGDMRAMGEGFSDYWAATVYAAEGDPAHQSNHAACVGEWDSTSYRVGNPTCLRRVDGTKRYPQDLVGDVHLDGEIWSAALWDIRNVLGGPTTDQIVLEHQFSVPCAATMPQAALEMIAADAQLNGGINENVLREKFCDRGILSGAECIPTEPGTRFDVRKDSTLVLSAKNRNEGINPQLRLKETDDKSKASRAVVKFNLSQVDLATVQYATLVLHVAKNPGKWWKGRPVDAHPLRVNFIEGDGKWAGVDAAERTRGSGKGTTWNCRTDQAIENKKRDCAWGWSGGKFADATAAPVIHTNDMAEGAPVEWGVTQDVIGGAKAWVIKKRDETRNGRIFYYSREGAEQAGHPEWAPHLMLWFK